MEFEINKKYRISVEIGGRHLIFMMKVLEIDLENNNITFVDKFGTKKLISKKVLVEAEEYEW